MKWPAIDQTLRRTMDATVLNAVANDPAVRIWLGGDGDLDLTPQLANTSNLAGVTDDGGFVAQSLGDGRYEIHSLFRPHRTTSTVKAMRAALDYVFAASDATELVTKVPTDNAAADGLARLAGFRAWFSGSLPWSNGTRKAMDVRVLSLDEWAMRSTVARCLGTWLHEQFADVLSAHGSTLPPHSDQDDMHDQMAGAAALMIRHGNTGKGVLFYNRWASVAGYPIIRWLRDHPVVLDLEGIIVEVTSEQIEVLQCQ